MRIDRSGSGSGSASGGPSGNDTSVIPMINVVFLLLVFFMVAGTIGSPDPLEATPPESSRTADAPFARRTLHLGADGTLALDDEPIAVEALAAALARSSTADEGMPAPSALARDDDQTPVATMPIDETTDTSDLLALRADAGTGFALLRDTIDALRDAGVEQVELITLRVPGASTHPSRTR